MNTPKRFIAGAICPSCKAMDKLVMWMEQDIPYRQCMACGFTDSLNEQGLSTAKELSSRVNPHSQQNESTVQVIKFFPNPNLNKQLH